LLHNQPEDVEFTLIDLKGGLEFGVYENLPQVKNFATNAAEAKEALENVKGGNGKDFRKATEYRQKER
jgi:S-DNA-T family DNA segregation ATPase FtsK/SpoIIIE